MGFNYHSKTEGNSDQQFSCHGKLENVGGNSDQQFSCHGKLGNVGGNSDQQFSCHGKLGNVGPTIFLLWKIRECRREF